MSEHNLLHLAVSSYYRRIRANLNVIIGIVGPPGAGKSSLAMRIAEILRDKYGMSFSVDNVFFDPAEFLEALSQRHSVVILDEAGVAINSRNFMQDLNKAINFAVQTTRFKNSVMIFVAPHIRFIDKAVRTLIMHIWRAEAFYTKGQFVRLVKPFFVSTDHVHDTIKIVPATYTVGRGVLEYPWMQFNKPDEKLWKEYLKRKEKWFENAKKQWARNISKEMFEEDVFKILQNLESKGYDCWFTVEDLALALGLSDKTIYKYIHNGKLQPYESKNTRAKFKFPPWEVKKLLREFKKKGKDLFSSESS